VTKADETPAAPLDLAPLFLAPSQVRSVSHNFSTTIRLGYIPISAALADNPSSTLPCPSPPISRRP
jgi:hypothetical protein